MSFRLEITLWHVRRDGGALAFSIDASNSSHTRNGRRRFPQVYQVNLYRQSSNNYFQCSLGLGIQILRNEMQLGFPTTCAGVP